MCTFVSKLKSRTWVSHFDLDHHFYVEAVDLQSDDDNRPGSILSVLHFFARVSLDPKGLTIWYGQASLNFNLYYLKPEPKFWLWHEESVIVVLQKEGCK